MVLQNYLTELVLSYARQYIRNIEANLKLSLWGSDLVLNNLDIKLDVLQRELGVPREFKFSRGFIKQLRIHIPWSAAALSYKPIEVTFTEIECELNFNSDTQQQQSGDEATASSDAFIPSPLSAPPPTPTPAVAKQLELEEARETGGSAGWAAERVTKILANLCVKIQGLSFLFVEDVPATNNHNNASASSSSSSSSSSARHLLFALRIDSASLHSTNGKFQLELVDLDGPWRLIHKAFEMKGISIHLGEISAKQRQAHLVWLKKQQEAATNMQLMMQQQGGSHAKKGNKAEATTKNESNSAKGDPSASIPTSSSASSSSSSSPSLLLSFLSDDSLILRKLSFTIRLRVYLASLLGPSLLGLPYEAEEPPPPSGPAVTADVHIHQAAHFFLSDQQLSFIMHIIKTKAEMVDKMEMEAAAIRKDAIVPSGAAPSSSSSSTSSSSLHPHHRSSSPAIITAESLQHLAFLPDPLLPVPKRRPSNPSALTLSRAQALANTNTSHTGSASSHGWLSWMWSMVSEEDEEFEASLLETSLPPSNNPQEFFDAFGHLAPKEELMLCLQIPAVTLHLSRRVARQEKNDANMRGRYQPHPEQLHASTFASSTLVPFASLHIHEFCMLASMPLSLPSPTGRPLSPSPSSSLNGSVPAARPPLLSVDIASLSFVDETPATGPCPLLLCGHEDWIRTPCPLLAKGWMNLKQEEEEVEVDQEENEIITDSVEGDGCCSSPSSSCHPSRSPLPSSSRPRPFPTNPCLNPRDRWRKKAVLRHQQFMTEWEARTASQGHAQGDSQANAAASNAATASRSTSVHATPTASATPSPALKPHKSPTPPLMLSGMASAGSATPNSTAQASPVTAHSTRIPSFVASPSIIIPSATTAMPPPPVYAATSSLSSATASSSAASSAANSSYSSVRSRTSSNATAPLSSPSMPERESGPSIYNLDSAEEDEANNMVQGISFIQAVNNAAEFEGEENEDSVPKDLIPPSPRSSSSPLPTVYHVTHDVLIGPLALLFDMDSFGRAPWLDQLFLFLDLDFQSGQICKSVYQNKKGKGMKNALEAKAEQQTSLNSSINSNNTSRSDSFNNLSQLLANTTSIPATSRSQSAGVGAASSSSSALSLPLLPPPFAAAVRAASATSHPSFASVLPLALPSPSTLVQPLSVHIKTEPGLHVSGAAHAAALPASNTNNNMMLPHSSNKQHTMTNANGVMRSQQSVASASSSPPPVSLFPRNTSLRVTCMHLFTAARLTDLDDTAASSSPFHPPHCNAISVEMARATFCFNWKHKCKQKDSNRAARLKKPNASEEARLIVPTVLPTVLSLPLFTSPVPPSLPLSVLAAPSPAATSLPAAGLPSLLLPPPPPLSSESATTSSASLTDHLSSSPSPSPPPSRRFYRRLDGVSIMQVRVMTRRLEYQEERWFDPDMERETKISTASTTSKRNEENMMRICYINPPSSTTRKSTASSLPPSLNSSHHSSAASRDEADAYAHAHPPTPLQLSDSTATPHEATVSSSSSSETEPTVQLQQLQNGDTIDEVEAGEDNLGQLLATSASSKTPRYSIDLLSFSSLRVALPLPFLSSSTSSSCSSPSSPPLDDPLAALIASMQLLSTKLAENEAEKRRTQAEQQSQQHQLIAYSQSHPFLAAQLANASLLPASPAEPPPPHWSLLLSRADVSFSQFTCSIELRPILFLNRVVQALAHIYTPPRPAATASANMNEDETSIGANEGGVRPSSPLPSLHLTQSQLHSLINEHTLLSREVALLKGREIAFSNTNAAALHQEVNRLRAHVAALQQENDELCVLLGRQHAMPLSNLNAAANPTLPFMHSTINTPAMNHAMR